MNVMRWVIIVVVLAAAAAIGFAALQRFTTPTVLVTEVVRGPVVQAFYATGTLQPLREYTIKSNVDGIVTEVAADKGDAVRQGQKLAFVRVDEYHMAYSHARADFELAQEMANEASSPALLEFDAKIQAATVQLQLAQDELARLTEARATNAASRTDVDRANDRVQTLWSAVESLKSQRAAKLLELQRDLTVARTALDIAQWNLDQQIIPSPVDGVVLDRPVSVGTRVKINDPLMRVANVAPDQLVMRAAVDEEDKTRVRLDQKVLITLYSYAGRVFEGRVHRVYPQADPIRRTFEVDVEIRPADPNFAAGMTGELAFVVNAREDAALIPSQAVQGGNVWTIEGVGEGRQHVLGGGGRLVKSNATLGLRSIERSEVTSGLQPGDLVVISPVLGLQPGQHVRLRYLDPNEAANLNKPSHESDLFRGFRP